ncbi:unnamed protein product [Adineta ricciae]|uniref:Carboxylesterase type B domain-containing protein n=1 Tax=Adineta ricciae TaxID=249248 RepID=A0A815II77_ADIRI|nr:unnamed protein product [Adineta ricciae]
MAYQNLRVFKSDVSLQTRKGVVYGRQTRYSNEYLGIQYAKVERWKPPVDLASEVFPRGSLQATSFGPCCPQIDFAGIIPQQDEQCLYLNIYTPLKTTNQSSLPVLIWIHGGGLQIGCSSQSIPVLYNGTNIIANSPSQQSVIVVTINYRLSVLGDMYLTELAQENPTTWPTAGNYYYLDMLSALRWINMNIRDYGGNPNNVLLFGESLGANAVIDIGALRGSSDLYQHIISQSSAAGFHQYYSNISDALKESSKIVQQMNCTNIKNRDTLTCLRNSSISDLIAAYSIRQAKPIIDGYFFPFYPPLAIARGKYNQNINMIIGRNEYETTTCSSDPDMNSTSAIAVITQSVGQKWTDAFVNSSRMNTCSSNRNASNRTRRIYNNLYRTYEQRNLFWYQLDCNPGICPPKTTEEGKGLCIHTAELPYVFGTMSEMYSTNLHNCTWDNESKVYSNRIILHWINMATVGEPLKTWPNYSPELPKYFRITPYHDFSAALSTRDCFLIDQFEQENILLMFGNSENLSAQNYANRNMFMLFIILLFLP